MDFKKIIFSFVLVAFVASQTCCDLNTLKVTGNANIKVKPDVATVQIVANAQANTTLDALKLLNQKISQLITIIKNQGIDTKDYSTSSLSLTQVYDYSSGTSRLTG